MAENFVDTHEVMGIFAGSDLGDCSVEVGYYGVNYGIYVHENLDAKHKPGKVAKFLEKPFIQHLNSGKIMDIIEKAVTNGASMLQACYMAGLFVQRESQKIVPILTTNLKGSAETRMIGGDNKPLLKF